MALGDLVHGLFGPANQSVAVSDRIQLNHRSCAVGDVGQDCRDAFGVAVVVEVPRLTLDLKTHVLGLYDVERLRPAQIRVLLPPPHDALGEDVFCRLHVLGSGHLENWMIGVDDLDLPLTLLRRKINIIVI